MSGINALKQRAKLSLDEMYDQPMVEKLDNRKNGTLDKKTSRKTASHMENDQNVLPKIESLPKNTVQQENQYSSKPVNQQVEKLEIQAPTPLPLITKQQPQKPNIYKMTFNLPEEFYKAFNDLYANRMLKGRKTEKSELICEAIQWLVNMEEKKQ